MCLSPPIQGRHWSSFSMSNVLENLGFYLKHSQHKHHSLGRHWPRSYSAVEYHQIFFDFTEFIPSNIHLVDNLDQPEKNHVYKWIVPSLTNTLDYSEFLFGMFGYRYLIWNSGFEPILVFGCHDNLYLSFSQIHNILWRPKTGKFQIPNKPCHFKFPSQPICWLPDSSPSPFCFSLINNLGRLFSCCLAWKWF